MTTEYVPGRPIRVAQEMILNWLTPERTHYFTKAHCIWHLLEIEDPQEEDNYEEYYAQRIAEKREQFRHEPKPKPYLLEVNLNKLGNLLGFNNYARKILQYLCITEYFHEFENLVTLTEFGSPRRSDARLIAEFIQIPAESVFALLGQKSSLIHSGIVNEKRDLDEGSVFSLADLQLALDLIQSEFQLSQLARTVGKVGRKPHLDIFHFAHLQPALDLLIPYLERSFKQAGHGANILIHGRLGARKFELARLLGQAIGRKIFEPSFFDENGDSLTCERKLAKVKSIFPLIKSERNLLVCKLAKSMHEESAQISSAAFTGMFKRLLKENELPIIWLCNSALHMNQDIIRQFDFVLEVTLPSRSQRYKMIQDAVSNLVSIPVIANLSTYNNLTPSVISEASKIFHQVHHTLQPSARDRTFERLISQAFRDKGHRAPIPARINADITFEPELASASIDLTNLVESLHLRPQGRICIEGPPGAGKTALAVWLAESLDYPLHSHRTANLLSDFLGQPEKAIAKAFQNVVRHGGILLIEEIDSLLPKQSIATQTWKDSQVKEMLSQMENFLGLLIATTHRTDALDAASRRRFDLTISLGYLNPKHIRQLFQITCTVLKLKRYRLPHSVKTIPNATLGDFAHLKQRHLHLPFKDGQSFAEALLSHCAGKQDRI